MDADDMGSDDYRPREHDHMVEPMFGGLGLERSPRTDQPLELPPGFRRFFRRLWRALVRLVRSSRPASGR